MASAKQTFKEHAGARGSNKKLQLSLANKLASPTTASKKNRKKRVVEVTTEVPPCSLHIKFPNDATTTQWASVLEDDVDAVAEGVALDRGQPRRQPH